MKHDYHVMIDIETLGQRSRSVILSIGAQVFRFDSIPTHEMFFYENVDRFSCDQIGLETDQSTIEWWEKQSQEAKDALLDPEPRPIDDVLISFQNWLSVCNVHYCWSHGSSFDCVILQEVNYIIFGRPLFSFRKFRDTRTCADLAGRTYDKEKYFGSDVKHHALSDAKAQALWVKDCYNDLHKIA